MQLVRLHPLVLIMATAALFALAACTGCLEPDCSGHDGTGRMVRAPSLGDVVGRVSALPIAAFLSSLASGVARATGGFAQRSDPVSLRIARLGPLRV